jgi:hypothetical protein
MPARWHHLLLFSLSTLLHTSTQFAPLQRHEQRRYRANPLRQLRRLRQRAAASSSLFNGETDELPPDELQRFLRADIQRRYRELILLGWLGRAYIVAPFLFDKFLPDIFRLSAYAPSAAACLAKPEQGIFDCVLKEGSVGGPKGIPFRLLLRTDSSQPVSLPWGRRRIESVTLLNIGCDLRRAQETTFAAGSPEEQQWRQQRQRWQQRYDGNSSGDGYEPWQRMGDEEVAALCAAAGEGGNKRIIVAAITSAIFSGLSPVGEALQREGRLGAWLKGRGEGGGSGNSGGGGESGGGRGGGVSVFVPRQETWGLEGTSEKWLQQVSGYYFAASVLQDVAFVGGTGGGGGDGSGGGANDDEGGDDAAVVFTFYLDPTEPLNSDNPTRIYNPEVVNCAFAPAPPAAAE